MGVIWVLQGVILSLDSRFPVHITYATYLLPLYERESLDGTFSR